MDPELPRVAGALGSRATSVIRYVGALFAVGLGAAMFATGFRWLLAVAFDAVSGAADVVSMFQRLPMAATTAATTHAPMMAAVLVFELSGDYAIVLPLLIATATATALSRVMRPDSIYSAELRKRGVAWEFTLEGRRVVDARGQSIAAADWLLQLRYYLVIRFHARALGSRHREAPDRRGLGRARACRGGPP